MRSHGTVTPLARKRLDRALEEILDTARTSHALLPIRILGELRSHFPGEKGSSSSCT